ncbi:MAG: hypothetical protein IKL77_02615 [Clostridia bacterium]|nr:hypothetical protein [Clostridia bacterium]
MKRKTKARRLACFSNEELRMKNEELWLVGGLQMQAPKPYLNLIKTFCNAKSLP